MTVALNVLVFESILFQKHTERQTSGVDATDVSRLLLNERKFRIASTTMVK